MIAHNTTKTLTPEQAVDICLNEDDTQESTKFQLWNGEMDVEVFDTCVSRDLVSICMVILPVYDPIEVRTYACKTSAENEEQRFQSLVWKRNNLGDARTWLIKQFEDLRTSKRQIGPQVLCDITHSNIKK